MKLTKSWQTWRDEVQSALFNSKDYSMLEFDPECTDAHQACPECGKKKLYSPDKFLKQGALKCASTHCGFYLHDLLAASAYWSKLTLTEMMREVSDQYGIEYYGSRKGKQAYVPPPKRRREPIAGIDFDDPEGLASVAEVSDNLECVEFGDEVDMYLSSRGINIHALPDVTGKQIYKSKVIIGKKSYVCMACPIVTADSRLIGWHKTILNAQGKKAFKNAKFFTKAIRKNAISAGHANIPLAKPVGGVIGFAEGIETSLSLIQAGYPVIPVMSANFLVTQVLSEEVKHVLIFADRDVSGTGQMAAADFASSIRERHASVKVDILLPPEHIWDKKANPKGIDWQDVLELNPRALG
jgi:phage/plasmid primase-like uncharacterized protein